MNNTGTMVIETKRNPGCLLQLLWFAFIGIWLSQAWMIVAWFFMATIIGIPLGIAMLNNIPKIIALREPTQRVAFRDRAMQTIEPPQVNILIRALYFLFIGLWLSAVWMEVAYLLCVSVIGLPIGFWMFDRVPAILTLKQS